MVDRLDFDAGDREAILRVLPATARTIVCIGAINPETDAELYAIIRAKVPNIRFRTPHAPDRAPGEGAEAGLLIADPASGAAELTEALVALDAALPETACIAFHVPSAMYHTRLAARLRDGGPVEGMERGAIIAAVKAAGLSLGRLAPVVKDRAEAEAAARALEARGAREGLTLAQVFERVAPSAFIGQTRPRRMRLPARADGRARGRPISVTGMTLGSKPDAMAIVRMHQPLQALNTLPEFAVEQVGPRPSLKRNADGTKKDIFVWQRPILTREHGDAIAKIRDTHERFVVEFDDHPMRWPAIQENDWLTFRAPDMVRTSTPALAEIIRQWNPNVYVAPNAVDRIPPHRWWVNDEGRPGPRAFTETEAALRDPVPVRLVFAALNRKEDWQFGGLEAIDAALARAGAELGLRHKIPAEETIRVDVVYDDDFHRHLRWPNKHRHGLLNYADYHALLHEAHVAFLPLQDTLFNRCKSDLKFLECAMHGVAMVASPTLYGPLMEGPGGHHVGPGSVFRDFRDLRNVLREMLAMPHRERAKMGARGYRVVEETRMRSHSVNDEARALMGVLERPPNDGGTPPRVLTRPGWVDEAMRRGDQARDVMKAS